MDAYGKGVFRFNYDLWRHYELTFTSCGWKIVNPHNKLSISSDTLTSAFWWKPFVYSLEEDQYLQEELKYIFRDIYGWCVDRGLARGNHFTYHSVSGKSTILGKAKLYFSVPETLVTMGKVDIDVFRHRKVVVKSLATARTNDGNILITTQVDVDSLDLNYPWCIQELIESDWDVTVFYCNKKSFAFKRNRSDLSGVDWRAHQSSDPFKKEWIPYPLSNDLQDRMIRLSEDLGVEFGRYDFLMRNDENDLVFLELNAHGQWVFLDYFSEHGLMDHFIKWLRGL